MTTGIAPDTLSRALACLTGLTDGGGTVTITMRALALRLGLSLAATHAAVHGLLARGDVQLVEPGRRAVGRGMNARPATYRVSREEECA